LKGGGGGLWSSLVYSHKGDKSPQKWDKDRLGLTGAWTHSSKRRRHGGAPDWSYIWKYVL